MARRKKPLTPTDERDPKVVAAAEQMLKEDAEQQTSKPEDASEETLAAPKPEEEEPLAPATHGNGLVSTMQPQQDPSVLLGAAVDVMAENAAVIVDKHFEKALGDSTRDDIGEFRARVFDRLGHHLLRMAENIRRQIRRQVAQLSMPLGDRKQDDDPDFREVETAGSADETISSESEMKAAEENAEGKEKDRNEQTT